MTDARTLAYAKELLAIESTAEHPKKLIEATQFFVGLLEKNKNITIEQFVQKGKPSLLAYFGSARPARFKVLFNGHLDVVPGLPEQFVPAVRQNRLYGRGASDMKVAALIMAEVFMQLGETLPFSLGLQLVTDEEIGGTNGTLHQITEGVQADLVIAGEDTYENTICTEMRGVCWAEIVFRGRTAHGAYVWRGTNALLEAAKYVECILGEYPIPQTDIWRTTVNVASLTTPNKTPNRVPDEAILKLDFRYTPEDPHFNSLEKIQHFLGQLDPQAEVKVIMYEPSHKATAGHPMVKKLASALTKVTGEETTFIKKHGAADVRFYSARGMQAVTCGLPDHNTHAENEYVELDWIAKYRQFLEQFLASLAIEN